MSMGFQYAERMDAAGVLNAHFGQHRRMHWPGWRPLQVCANSLLSAMQLFSPLTIPRVR